MHIYLSTFETANGGQVWQVNSQFGPSCKEMDNEADAWRVIFKLAEQCPKAMFSKWDGYTQTQSPELPIREAIAQEA